MVALIARAHLTPQASAEVDRLLRENPVEPPQERNCRDHPDDLMALYASWADSTKSSEMNGAWHFIDIPRAVGGGDVMKWCRPMSDGRPGCIVTAFEYEWTILRDRSQSGAARAKALRYVVHLIGDLTQPLHEVDNHDQGGNCDEMRFLGAEKPEQLHGIWDYRILQHELDAKKQSTGRYAHGIDNEFPGMDVKLDVPVWAWESHKLATDIAYGLLNPPLPVAAADSLSVSREECTTERASVAALHINIGDDYISRVLPVIRKQIALAGYRLAALLNQAASSTAP
jgi:hypothetical protein